MRGILLPLLTCVLTALSLGLSWAHALESLPRLTTWSAELWREATVFSGQFRLFAMIGGPVEVSAIVLAGVLAYVMREAPGRSYALAGAVLFAAALVVFLTVVNPANGVLASWKPGPIPENFYAVRNRWESGHITIAAMKLLGFIAILWSILIPQKSATW